MNCLASCYIARINLALGHEIMTQIVSKISQDFQKIMNIVQAKKFEQYQIDKEIEGISFDFIIGDLEAEDWYASERTRHLNTHLEMRFLKEKIIAPGDIIFECGTHHGMTAILLSKWVGNEGKIVSFEIFPQNAEIAVKNINLNQLKNVVIEQTGLGESFGKTKIFCKSNSSIKPQKSLSLGFIRNAIYGMEQVDIIPLDSYVEKVGYDPTFLKIDVEGYESEVLKGAKNILQTTPKLAIEIHTEILDRYNTSVQEIFDLIDINRYQCWVQWKDSEMPVKYNLQQEINHRVHLFAIPK